MITLTYTYHCDFCRCEIIAPQKFMIQPLWAIPQPVPISIIDRKYACEKCIATALKAVHEELEQLAIVRPI